VAVFVVAEELAPGGVEVEDAAVGPWAVNLPRVDHRHETDSRWQLEVHSAESASTDGNRYVTCAGCAIGQGRRKTTALEQTF